MDLSGINGIVKREMIKYWRAKSRIFVNMLMPIMFMLIIGPAFGSMFAGEGAAISVDYTGIENFFHFMAPGIVAMSLLMGSIFNAGMPILMDKMMGFSDVITASPIKRGNIVIGFVLAGSLKALIQGVILLVIALVMGVPITGILALSIIGLIIIMLIIMQSKGIFINYYTDLLKGFIDLLFRWLLPYHYILKRSLLQIGVLKM